MSRIKKSGVITLKRSITGGTGEVIIQVVTIDILKEP